MKMKLVPPHSKSKKTIVVFIMNCLFIYNSLGQGLKKLVDTIRDTGTHTVQFGASGFESGVYFCRLITETGIVTRKLLLIR